MARSTALYSKAILERSRFVESTLTHQFIAELSQVVWRHDPTLILSVLRSEVDESGIDLIVEFDGVVRHIQLKQRNLATKSKSPVIVNKALFARTGGCVVILNYSMLSLKIEGFLWYGSDSSARLAAGVDRPVIKVPGTQGRRTRKNTTSILMSKFEPLSMVESVANRLFDYRLSQNLFNGIGAVETNLCFVANKKQLSAYDISVLADEACNLARDARDLLVAGSWDYIVWSKEQRVAVGVFQVSDWERSKDGVLPKFVQSQLFVNPKKNSQHLPVCGGRLESIGNFVVRAFKSGNASV